MGLRPEGDFRARAAPRSVYEVSMAVKKLTLDSITLDPALHARAEVDPKTVDRYARDLLAGDEFPPIKVFTDGKTYWPSSGWHRIHAHSKAVQLDPSREDLLKITAYIHNGTGDDALKDASQDDRNKPRTKQDKLAYASKMLARPDLANLSNAELSRLTGVSDKTIKKLRDGEPSEVLRTDGKKRSATTKRRPKPVDQDIQGSENPGTRNSEYQGPAESDESGEFTLVVDSGPPIDTSAEIFREADPRVDDDFPVYAGATAAEVLARSGLPKPVNWVEAPKREMAEVKRPGLSLAELKRRALPQSWVDVLHEAMELGATEDVVLRLLRTFVDRRLKKSDE